MNALITRLIVFREKSTKIKTEKYLKMKRGKSSFLLIGEKVTGEKVANYSSEKTGVFEPGKKYAFWGGEKVAGKKYAQRLF